MRWLGVSLVVVLTACSSSPDPGGSPTADQNPSGSGGSSGGAGVAVSGTGGQVVMGTAGGSGGTNLGSGGAPLGSGGSTGAAGRGGSAGNGGTAGYTGKPDAGVVVVRACNNLPPVGEWQNISPMAFKTPSNMESLAVVVNPLDQTVYAAAGNKTNGGNSGTGVYKSSDCGATWALVSTGMNSDKLMSGDPWAMLIDPVQPQTLYTNNGYGNDPTIYKSTNGGVDWTALSPNPMRGVKTFVQAIAMDPTDPSHLAATFHENCTTPYNASCLSYSSDAGATWHLFNGPASLGGWQEAATLTVLGPTSYLYAANGAWYTGDTGQTWTQIESGTFYASYAGSTDLAPDGTIYLSGGNSLYSSHSNPLGSSWATVATSPHASSIIDDGVNLFASYAWDNSGQPFYTAKLSAPTVWTHMPSPSCNRGPNQLAHDGSHHIVYSANWAAGLWRLVTR